MQVTVMHVPPRDQKSKGWHEHGGVAVSTDRRFPFESFWPLAILIAFLLSVESKSFFF